MEVTEGNVGECVQNVCSYCHTYPRAHVSSRTLHSIDKTINISSKQLHFILQSLTGNIAWNSFGKYFANSDSRLLAIKFRIRNDKARSKYEASSGFI